jgi:phosphatidylglycerophosphate synthase
MTEAAQTIIVLADETASCIVAGLTQLERLLREIERCWPSSPRAASGVAEVAVVWRSRELHARQPVCGGRQPIGVRVHHVDDDDGNHSGLLDAVTGGRALVLATSQVWAPGGLLGLLSSPWARRGDCTSVPACAAALEGTDAASGSGSAALWEPLTRCLLPVRAGGSAQEGGLVGVLAWPGDVPRVERALFRSLGKPSDGYMTRLVNRRLSTAMSRCLARMRVTPNQLSSVVGALFLASALSLVKSGGPMLLLGTVLYKMGDILDGCDGEIARVKFMESRLGAWLDTTIDMVGNVLFIGALGIGLSRHPDLFERERSWYLWEGLMAAGAMMLVVWAMTRHTRATSGDAHFAGFGTTLAASLPDRSRLRRSILIVSRLLRRDAYSWAFVLLAALGRPAWILHAQAAGLIVYFLGLWYAGRVVPQKRPTALAE